MKKTLPPGQHNMLHEIHARLNDLSIVFRNRVCEECGWSVPTFYRKMRAEFKGHDKSTPILSNAEREKILAVFDEVMFTVINFCDKFRNRRNGR
jgi:hypothetical protein